MITDPDVDRAGSERAGALGKATGSDFEEATVTRGGGVKERDHARVRIHLAAPPSIEAFPHVEIDRRNDWKQSAEEIARVGIIDDEDAVESRSLAREAMGLSEFLRVIDDNVTTRGRIADMHQRFLNFVAACWVIGVPWLDGRGLREVAESLNVSHETLRLRATRIAGDLQLRTTTISGEHKQALKAARERRAQEAA